MEFSKRLIVCLSVAVLLSGCSRGPRLGEVTGKVTLQGAPIENCVVNFQPTAKEGGLAASGITDAQGNYSLKTIESPQRKGAPANVYRVTFFWRDPDMSKEIPGPPPYKIPPQYESTGISFTVPQGGSKTADFDLTSK